MVPAAGVWVLTNRLAGVQLSAARTLVSRLGTRPKQLVPAETVNWPGALRITGAVVSTTLKQVLPGVLLPAAPLPVPMIGCWPSPRKAPASGFWVTTNWLAGVQLSF